MDEDLKIVLTSELEADEQASAQRISAQLPNIAKLINSKNSIKIGVELATPNTQAMQGQVQRISSQISKAANVDVGVKFHVTRDAKRMLRDAMNGIGDGGVDSKITAAMTKNLDEMQVKVKNISAEWVKVGKTKERLVQLSISGTTKDQQDVEILQMYNNSGEKVLETTKRLSLNLEKIERQERAAAAQAAKDNESRLNYYQRQSDALEKLKTQYESPKNGLLGEDNFGAAEEKYNLISGLLDDIRDKSGAVSEAEKRNIESEISALQRLIQTRRDEETVADAAAKKERAAAAQAAKDNESRVSYLNRQLSLLNDIQSAYTGATSVKPVTNDSHLEKLGETYTAINAQIQSMIAAEGRLDSVQRSNLEAQIAGLKRLVKEYQNAEYVATKLRTKDVDVVKTEQIEKINQFEQKLRESGTLTDDLQRGIDHLRVRITSAFDAESIVLFLNKFDTIQNRAQTLEGKISHINSLWKDLGAASNKVFDIRQMIESLDSVKDAGKIEGLQRELELYQGIEIELGKQIRSYGNLNRLAQSKLEYERQAELLARQAATAEGEIADKARSIDAEMKRIPTTIRDIETRFKRVIEPTETLEQNMRELREMEAQYHASTDDREKIRVYEKLKDVIGDCNEEITKLTRVQRGDVLDFKFTQNLEKAKADLATIGRTWSAFTKDDGLRAQFNQLSQDIKRVDNQMDLNKWNAQFSRFKSEVKAAGKNMQSLGDIFKNNLEKVTQWVSATTLLFKAFDLLKNAVSTVIDLDTAMIDLRKTTDATEAEYRQFYLTANETAKNLGSTTEAVIAQTAEWSRLGYSMQEAAELAKNSAVFAAVSPEMDQQTATDGLISIIKAFDEIDIDDTMDGIISKVNAVGKLLPNSTVMC